MSESVQERRLLVPMLCCASAQQRVATRLAPLSWSAVARGGKEQDSRSVGPAARKLRHCWSEETYRSKASMAT